jgi:hypothetical protein
MQLDGGVMKRAFAQRETIYLKSRDGPEDSALLAIGAIHSRVFSLFLLDIIRVQTVRLRGPSL